MKDKQDEDLSKEPEEQPNGHIPQGEAQPSHQKHVTCENSEIREVASQFVTDLIYKAKEVAQRQQSRIDEVDEEEEEEEMPPPRRILDLTAGPAKTPPEIQIDLVGSLTPSPEEEIAFIAPDPTYKEKKVIILQDDTSESENSGEASPDTSPRRKLLQDGAHDCRDIADLKNDPELRDFAVAYIKGILEQAALLAQERAPDKTEEFISETSALKKAAGPWYSRIRAAVARCLRTGCFCVVRRQSTSS